MAKKKKNLQEEVLISEQKESLNAVVVTDSDKAQSAKDAKKSNEKAKSAALDAKNAKAGKKKEKKPKEKKLRKKARETISELKKVTWPTFGEVCKKTGIVLSVVVLFGLLLFGLDTLLGYLFGLLT